MSIENMDKLLAKLTKLKNMDKAVMDGLELGALRVESDAKISAPSNDGHLRASITHEKDEAKLQVAVGTNLHYAPYVEFGTGVFAAGGDGRKTPWSYQDAEGNWYTTAGQHPQPFLEPSLEKNKAQIKKDVAKAVEKYIGGIGEK